MLILSSLMFTLDEILVYMKKLKGKVAKNPLVILFVRLDFAPRAMERVCDWGIEKTAGSQAWKTWNQLNKQSMAFIFPTRGDPRIQ